VVILISANFLGSYFMILVSPNYVTFRVRFLKYFGIRPMVEGIS
jgi:hypothetical protein